MRRPFTVPADERAIMALQPDGTDQKLKVAGVPHLFVRVKPSGRRTFCAFKRVKVAAPALRRRSSRTLSRVLGEVGVMTLREAVLGSKVAVREWRIMELEARVAELEADLQEHRARSAADA